MKFHIHDIRTIALILCFAVAGLQTEKAQAQSVEEILASHIEALGGEEKIKSIKSVHRTGDLRFESEFTGALEGSMEIIVLLREKLYQSSDLGAYSTTTAWDGETAWEEGPQGLRTLQGNELNNLIDQSNLFFTTGLWRTDEQTITKLEDKDLNGKRYHLLEYKGLNASSIVVYFDASTFLVSQMISSTDIPGIGPGKVVIKMGDYDSFAGVMMTTSVLSSLEGVFSSDVQFLETTVNKDFQDAMFTKPGK